MIVSTFDIAHAPATKLALAIAIAFLLSIPLFSVWLLVYDRQTQSREATASIAQGWGTDQAIEAPVLMIPYRTTVMQGPRSPGQGRSNPSVTARVLTLSPQTVLLKSDVAPEVRKRSIYRAIVYSAAISGSARFGIPADLDASGIDLAQLDLARAQLRFAVSDPGALGQNPRVIYRGHPLRLDPAGASNGRSGFFASLDATALASKPIEIEFSFGLRGKDSLSLVLNAGDTTWNVHSTWASPSFGGKFLPTVRRVRDSGFDASYRIGNLALGRSLMTDSEIGNSSAQPASSPASIAQQAARISFIEPVDPYSQVDRATKYGFLFIGLTFLALLMFEVVGRVRVSSVEYLLMGAALVLFFVLLLALAEVVGFTPGYILASVSIGTLNTTYSAAVLRSWKRAAFIGCELIALYAVLYVLLSLEAYSLLIGSLLLFAVLAAVMYATRSTDWGGIASKKELAS